MADEEVDYSSGDFTITSGSIGLKIFLIFMVSLIITVVFLFVYSIRMRNSVTEGLEPSEVVELFYNSCSDYDLTTVNGCINTGKITVLNNRHMPTLLYNIRRNKEEFTHGGKQLEQEGMILKPEKWIENGKPDLLPGYIVEGIVNLKITEISPLEYKADYDYYFTVTDSSSGIPTPQFINYTDTCLLVRKRGNWIIDEIIQLD